MSVGEVWKEKKNIVLVGNTQTSFVLYCTAVPGSRQLFCENAQCLVTLQPIHFILCIHLMLLMMCLITDNIIIIQTPRNLPWVPEVSRSRRAGAKIMGGRGLVARRSKKPLEPRVHGIMCGCGIA